MRKLFSIFAALASAMSMSATSIWSGSQDVHWDNTITIDASKFASVQAGNKIEVTLSVNDGTNDAIEFKANGQKLPGTRFSLCQDWWETYDLFMTQDMVDSCKVYGMEICGDNFKVTNIDLSEGKAANMKEGKVIWTGYFWVEHWYTLEVFKEALTAVKDWSKYSAMRFYSECPTTDNLISLLANWDEAGVIAKSEPATDTIAGNPLKRYEGYAELDLTKVNPLTVINALSSDRLMIQMDKQGSAPFYFTDVVLVEQATPWVPDTISVTEARARIDSGNSTQCYVYGVVATAPSDPGSFKNTIFWLTDIDNPTDSLEGYKIAGLNGADIPTIDDIPFGIGDTVMIFANTLSYYVRDDIYEIHGGYYVETLGKATIINATSLFPFAYGAIVGEADDAEERYHFDVVLTSEEGNPDKGIHMGIVSSHQDGIEGTYTLYPDNSFVNGTTEGETISISGSVKISYVEAGSVYNKYNIATSYSMNGHIYRIDSVYEIPAITDEHRINLVGDTPFIPNEGDTITCAQALRYAKTLESGMKGIVNVYIHGWVSSKPRFWLNKTYQCSFYMDDVPEGTKNSPAQSYYCYEQGLDSICVGDEVLLYGQVQLYNGTAEISTGQIIRINDGAKHYRDIQCIDMTTSYISVDRAYEIGMALDAAPGETVESEVEYTVAGYIAKVDYQTKNDTATWFMTDDKTSTYGNLLAYKCYIPSLIAPEDAVMITGKILKYVKNNGTNISIEFRAATAAFLCHLEKNYTISTAVNDDQRGMVQGGKSASYLEEITLTAVANDGYHFTQWNDGNTANPRTIIVTQDSVFTAMFANDITSNVITYTATEQLRGYKGSLTVGATTFGSAITSHTFSNGTGTITCSGEITTIGDRAFDWCTNMTSVDIPNSVKTIEDWAFYNCGLTSIAIPNSVTQIGRGTFSVCSGLTSITIPNSVTMIGDSAFHGCRSLISITIGNSVATIGSGTLEDCRGLTSIDVDSANTHYASIEGVLFNYAKDTLIQYPIGNPRTKYTIPNSVITIGEYAFYGCNGLTSVIIGNSVTMIGIHAFGGCSGLTSITIPNSVTTIGNYAFTGCLHLTSITIGNSVTTIGDGVFNMCTDLTSVTIPNAVKKIGNYAFKDCSGLTSITCYATTPPICGNDCFYNVNKSIPVYVPTLSVDAYKQADEWKEFMNIQAIKQGQCGEDLYWQYNDALLVISGTGAMYDYTPGTAPWIIYFQDSINNLVINNGCTSIGNNAFANCTVLTSVTIPNSVTTIEGAAFYGCTGLTSITIPNSVTTIGVAAFEDCSGLTKTNYTGTIADWCKIQFGNPSANPMYYSYNFYINDVEIKDLVIPEGVDTIENSAFVGCIGLTSITIPYSVTTIGNDVFFGCSGLIKTNYTGTIADWCKIKFGTTYANPMYRSHNFYINDVEIKDLVIPEGVDTIENFAFSHCSGLTSVTIPNSVIAIGKYAFSHCSGLTSITSYVTNPPTCGKNCFYNVNKSIPVYVPTLSVDAYQQAEEWKEFTNILPIGAEEVPVTNPIITPNNHSVTITWPQINDADTYTLEIKKNNELVCTLTFDNQGVMTNIAFAAPSRGGVRTSSNAEMTGNGYRFTVMWLETGTDYTYAVTAKDASQQTLKTYSGEFTTTGSISTGINGLTIDNGASAHSDKCTVRKFIRHNQLQIMRNDKLFNALGGRIR